MTDKLPKTITITRSFTYDIDRIIADRREYNGEYVGGEPTDIYNVMEWLEEYVYEDFSSIVLNARDLLWTDENGNEI